MGKKVIIIGGGVAGMQTAITLSKLGISPVIIEREETIGGKLNRWDRLFPTMTPASEVLGIASRTGRRFRAEISRPGR